MRDRSQLRLLYAWIVCEFSVRCFDFARENQVSDLGRGSFRYFVGELADVRVISRFSKSKPVQVSQTVSLRGATSSSTLVFLQSHLFR